MGGNILLISLTFLISFTKIKAYKVRHHRKSKMFEFKLSKKFEDVLTYFYLVLCIYGAVMIVLASLKLLGVF